MAPKASAQKRAASQALVSESPSKKPKIPAAATAGNDWVKIMTELERIPAVTAYKTGRDTGYVNQVSLAAVFCDDPDVVKRLERFTVAPNVTGLINIATIADYSAFKTAIYKTIMLRESKTNTACIFFVVGIVTYCSLLSGEKSRQICIAPADLTWSRVIAGMGKLYGKRKISMSTYFDGVSFSTKSNTENSQQGTSKPVGMSSLSPSKKKNPSFKNGPLPWNASVPTFDGSGPFKLEEYTKLPLIKTELMRNSAALVAFGLGSYTSISGGALANHGVDTCMSLNVQAVVLLAKPIPQPKSSNPGTSSISPAADPGHLGVLSETESEEVEGEEVAEVGVGNEDDSFFL